MTRESYLTAEEVSAWLRVGRETVYRMARAGRMPPVRVGRLWRFRKSDINAWLQDREVLAKQGTQSPEAMTRVTRPDPERQAENSKH